MFVARASGQAGIGQPGLGQPGLGQPLPGQPGPPGRQIVTTPFGAANGQGNTGRLTLTASMFETYDVNQRTESVSATTTAVQPVYWRTGLRTGGNAGLAYTTGKQWTRASITANGRTLASAFSGTDRVIWTGSGGVSEILPIGRRMSLNATQTMSFRPFYNFGLFPGVGGGGGGQLVAIDPSLDLAVFPSLAFEYGLQGGLSYRTSRRSMLMFDYTRRYTDFRDGTGDFDDQQVGGRWTYQLTRTLNARLGYRYGKSSSVFTGGQPIRHGLDVGLDYSLARGFTVSRMTFSFNTGSSILSDASGAGPRFTRSSLRLTGAANLSYDLGRTWTAGLQYRRGWEAVVGFPNPFFTDTVSTGIGGNMGRQMTLGFTAGYLHSTAWATSGSGGQDAYTAAGTWRRRVASWGFLYAQYNFYRFAFTDQALLPVGFPAGLDRHSARAGFSLSLPLIR